MYLGESVYFGGALSFGPLKSRFQKKNQSCPPVQLWRVHPPQETGCDAPPASEPCKSLVSLCICGLEQTFKSFAVNHSPPRKTPQNQSKSWNQNSVMPNTSTSCYKNKSLNHLSTPLSFSTSLKCPAVLWFPQTAQGARVPSSGSPGLQELQRTNYLGRLG